MLAVVCFKGVTSAEWAPSLPVLATEHWAPPALSSALPNQVCSFSFWMLTDVVSVSDRWELSLLSDLFISQHRTWVFSWAKTLQRVYNMNGLWRYWANIKSSFQLKHLIDPDQCVQKQSCRKALLIHSWQGPGTSWNRMLPDLLLQSLEPDEFGYTTHCSPRMCLLFTNTFNTKLHWLCFPEWRFQWC